MQTVITTLWCLVMYMCVLITKLHAKINICGLGKMKIKSYPSHLISEYQRGCFMFGVLAFSSKVTGYILLNINGTAVWKRAKLL